MFERVIFLQYPFERVDVVVPLGNSSNKWPFTICGLDLSPRNWKQVDITRSSKRHFLKLILRGGGKFS